MVGRARTHGDEVAILLAPARTHRYHLRFVDLRFKGKGSSVLAVEAVEGGCTRGTRRTIRRNSTRDAHLGDGRLGQQDAADGLGGCDNFLDQHTVEKRNETLGHLILGEVREKECASALQRPPTS